MKLGLHKFLRVMVPGAFLAVEGFFLYVFCFLDFPSTSDTWSLLSRDLGKTTGFALLSLLLGAIYHYLGVTELIDDKSFHGMQGIRDNITDRLTRPFRSDPAVASRLSDIDWRILRRVFFRFIDEIPHLATSNQLAFFSGLGFYAAVDLATISSLYTVAIVVGWMVVGAANLAVKLYVLVLLVSVAAGIVTARVTIRKHRETSDIQLDAILADHQSELRERILKSLDVR